MQTNNEMAAAATLSDRARRALMNQLAHRLSQEYFRQTRERLIGQLDSAEMRGRDAQLLTEWQSQLNGNLLGRSKDHPPRTDGEPRADD